MFFYGDSGAGILGKQTHIDTSRFKPETVTRLYLEHVANELFLEFMAVKGTLVERAQAEKELTICRRKIVFWTRHAAFEDEPARRGKEVLIQNWQKLR
jgi:hypothetical protein